MQLDKLLRRQLRIFQTVTVAGFMFGSSGQIMLNCLRRCPRLLRHKDFGDYFEFNEKIETENPSITNIDGFGVVLTNSLA
ncbi:MAG: hypothetical protein ACLFWI_08065 [Coleofasciculus sp.]|uniref:hypothetical protein n=1 Tax=Coleofasciculus sp. TaxID=3100458 RepID=UPI003A14D038